MAFHIWTVFFLAYLVTTLSPGPNVLLVLKNSIQYGWKSAFITIVGNLFCQFFIVCLVALGVGTLLQTLPNWFLVMKVLGGTYLIYLGIKALRSSKTSTFEAMDRKFLKEKSGRALFVEAFFVSASNPKTLIFLSAFLPQFLTLDNSAYVQFSVMFITICFIVISVHIGYAFGITCLSQRFSLKNMEAKIAKVTGGLFISMGSGILLSNR
ncbi:LysE family translocator [Marinomonas transparens]|uniref:LysE family translocator n=1 Tax=Marinomonas transparens TaxID=2795388 RepID=A0A934MVC1_9GAMM|nr:LysE family translocator [Marinomonas transparens]MBJ7536859.1 LysE family translocator [Marinomonas transparens]